MTNITYKEAEQIAQYLSKLVEATSVETIFYLLVQINLNPVRYELETILKRTAKNRLMKLLELEKVVDCVIQIAYQCSMDPELDRGHFIDSRLNTMKGGTQDTNTDGKKMVPEKIQEGKIIIGDVPGSYPQVTY